jgi:hypothetical protein
MIDPSALTLNSDCYCWPVKRAPIVETIVGQNAASDMASMLSERPHYFASTTIFLASNILAQMQEQIGTIEDVIKLPKYVEAVRERGAFFTDSARQLNTRGVFMGYDFHITEDGPRLIEINSNAGGAFIVDAIEQTVLGSTDNFSVSLSDMFLSEWEKAERTAPLKTIAIIDSNPTEQFHYPDMCLAKTLLERHGFTVVIADPKELRLADGRLYHGQMLIDLIYNRLTDFDLSETSHALIKRAYVEGAAVITPALHHHVLYADKRNLIMLSDEVQLSELGASPRQIQTLTSIPKTVVVTAENATQMWDNRRRLFFKPQAGFGSRGAFRGAKLTKKVWIQILEGGYIAQDLIAPPVRAVTVEGEKLALKFDVRVYTYDGAPLLFAARIYQGQTTNLRTAGGGLAAVIPVKGLSDCQAMC